MKDYLFYADPIIFLLIKNHFSKDVALLKLL
jgi:hypothetical protein